MLQEILIKNFAIIDEVHCSFDKGMTVLTGETGAGKSIIIDAVGLLIGERASLEMIRYGCDKAVIQGMFAVEEPIIQELRDLGIDAEDGQLLIQRELHRSGKTSCRINGQLTTVALLKQIGTQLIDIHGQNEHFLLLNPQKHLLLMDEYARVELKELLPAYTVAYQRYQQARKELVKAMKSEQKDAQLVDLLTHQVQEITSANLQIGEEASLIEEQNYFTHYQQIQQALLKSVAVLEGESSGALDSVQTVMQELQEIEEIDTAYQQLSTQVQDAYYQLQDVAMSVNRLLDRASYDEERAHEVEERLDTYYQLHRKYGETTEEILAFGEKAQEQLYAIQHREDHIKELEQQLRAAKKEAVTLANQLSSIRKEAAIRLTHAIHQQLQELYMEKVRFEVRFSKLERLNETGLDEIEFYVATNTGEPFKPLAKIVSGGELSRLTLALKTNFIQSQGIATVIFDEVDTGVSGRVAQAIASKMHYISLNAQVLCITHLPQVAAMATTQFRIEKMEKENRIQTNVWLLDPNERIEEVARMLAGEEVTELTTQHATELLEVAAHIREKNKEAAERE